MFMLHLVMQCDKLSTDLMIHIEHIEQCRVLLAYLLETVIDLK